VDFDSVGLGRVVRGDARLKQPLSVGELHGVWFLFVSDEPMNVGHLGVPAGRTKIAGAIYFVRRPN
jgi:hypothetical protein